MGRGRKKGIVVDGWLNLDKPEGVTSTHCVNIVKILANARKAGHGGTLDPLATGLLPIAFGEATKTVPYLMDSQKTYRFAVAFGAETDTDDKEGEVIAKSDVIPHASEIEQALPSFKGLIQQIPPAYAAVKVNGERAYDIARRGEEVKLQPREVQVDRFEMTGHNETGNPVFEVECGKGTYIRSLARDLGRKLGTFAHVAELRRIRVGAFDEKDAVTIEQFKEAINDGIMLNKLVDVPLALAGIPALNVTKPQAVRLSSGQAIAIAPRLLEDGTREGAVVKALNGDRLIALTRFDGVQLSPLRVFNL